MGHPNSTSALKEERRIIEDAYYFCRYFFRTQEELEDFLIESTNSVFSPKLMKEGRAKVLQRLWLQLVRRGHLDSLVRQTHNHNPYFDSQSKGRNLFFLLPAEIRSVLVLKDVLQYEDAEILEILELRWQVYRHRLHRARMDYLGLLSQTRELTS